MKEDATDNSKDDEDKQNTSYHTNGDNDLWF